MLVVRAWIEPTREDGFRARLTSRLDVAEAQEEVRTAATVEDALAIVGEWLETFRDAPVTGA